jgi:hypothetical protein
MMPSGATCSWKDYLLILRDDVVSLYFYVLRMPGPCFVLKLFALEVLVD